MERARYRAAVLDGFTIILDLTADEYIAVPQDPAAADARPQEAAICLGTSVRQVRVTDALTAPNGRRDLTVPFGTMPAAPSAADWLRLIRALPSALWSLHFGRPSTWIRDEDASFPQAESETIEAAMRFKSMRPFVPWLSRCLPHALLLRSYLRIGGHRSMLVIGVRLFPFEAHSWVQAGDVVLTDDLDLVAAYSVIAAG